MSQQLVGDWKLVDSENFETFLEKVGLSLPLRKVANAAKPHVKIEINEQNVWTIKTTTTLHSHSISFELDKPFNHQTQFSDKEIIGTVSWVNNELVQTESDLSGKIICTVKRRVDNGKLIVNMECGDVKSARIFVRE